MGYSPWSSKKFNRSELAQKIMQVGVDVKCMHAYFGGRGFSNFISFLWPRLIIVNQLLIVINNENVQFNLHCKSVNTIFSSAML